MRWLYDIFAAVATSTPSNSWLTITASPLFENRCYTLQAVADETRLAEIKTALTLANFRQTHTSEEQK